MNTFSGTITKERFLEEIKKHREADMLIQGTYGQEDGHWKGCAVACSLRSLDVIEGKETRELYDQHERYETELGIPEWLARVEDTIFEGLPVKEAQQWPERFTKAIPVGITAKQLDVVKWKFCLELLKENKVRVDKLDISKELKKDLVSALEQVEKVHTIAIKTGNWDESAADSARSATWSAKSAADSARSATWSAKSAAESAWSAAWSAAKSAADSARSAAWSAAWSAKSAADSAWSAAESAWSAADSAWSAAYQRYSNLIVTLLEEVI